MTTTDDLSLRSVLDGTLKDFGVQAAPVAAEPTPQADITKPPLDRRTQVMIAVSALLLIAIGSYLWGARQTTAPPQARPTALPTLQPTAAPTIAPVTPVRLLAAFAAPDGSTLGTIEATRPMTPTAHYGDEWIQAQVAGSGLIWLRAADLPLAALVGPDLAPRPTPEIAVQPAPAPVACAADTAPYRVERQVLVGTLPVGAAMGFSCVSAAEAEANASAHEAEVRASYAATTTTKTSEAR